MSEIEINGFDEAGNIGKNLRFVRVGMDSENQLRPFVYNLLHFGSITTSKDRLAGFSEKVKKEYLLKIHKDPTIHVNHYNFPVECQLDVLRQFTLREHANLYRLRGNLMRSITPWFRCSICRSDYCYTEKPTKCPSCSAASDSITPIENRAPQEVTAAISYLKRYEKTPYFMESFMKAYGFRRIVEDLKNTSRLLRNPTIDRYCVISQVDGGFPFVFWWKQFFEAQHPESRFSTLQTPIYGITKGDEYYPVTGMAGNIATITNSLSTVVYPHNVKEVEGMPLDDLNEFYSAFRELREVPKFHKRVLFFGKIEPELQYSIPYVLHVNDGDYPIYEPFRINLKLGNLRQFYKTFGYSEKDIVVSGELRSREDNETKRAFEERKLEITPCSDYVSLFGELLSKIDETADVSNLNSSQIAKIKSKTKSTLENTKKFHKE